MNFPRKLSAILLLIASLAMAGEYFQLEIPTARWFFSFGERIGWIMCGIVFLLAVYLFITGKNSSWNPITFRRFKGFRAITRGYVSWIVLLVILIITVPDHLLVGNRALAVKYNGKWLFPAFMKKNFTPQELGIHEEGMVNYRELQQKSNKHEVWMPLIPWNSTLDSDQILKQPLSNKKNYSGMAVRFYPNTTSKLHEVKFRNGKMQGRGDLYALNGEPIAIEEWNHGDLLERKVMREEAYQNTMHIAEKNYYALLYPPLPPSWSQRHLLGTDSRGWDVAAQLYGGLQVVVKVAVLYLILTFGIGISVGLISGYFGGAFDLFTQRLIEVISNIPFLFLVMIIASQMGREKINIATIVIVMCLFSWIGISTYKRAAALKEKARDYVASAKVLGASTPRILFHHILPNALSSTITLVPFTIVGVVASLTALDFIGFGLPEKYPSWGILLADGLSNFMAPWIVGSVFFTLVLILLLVTFIGEAIREAFDPKKFTTYH